jgi:hypothetical protein
VVGAVQCAIALQKLIAERNDGVPDERRRIGASVFNSVRFLIEGEVISANLGAHTGCTPPAVG